MNHTGRPELAIQFRIFTFETFVAQIDLMLFAFIAVLFVIVFRAAAHFPDPLLFLLLTLAPAKGYNSGVGRPAARDRSPITTEGYRAQRTLNPEL